MKTENIDKGILRELEKTVISLDGMLRQKRGELKPSEVQDKICEQWVAQMRKKYGFTAHSW
jgi:hypothetical protein